MNDGLHFLIRDKMKICDVQKAYKVRITSAKTCHHETFAKLFVFSHNRGGMMILNIMSKKEGAVFIFCCHLTLTLVHVNI